MNKRYYVKKGASSREFLRCPLCGKLSKVGYFSQNHDFGVFKAWFCGRGSIRWERSKKDNMFMVALTKGIANRLLVLLEQFTGLRYVPSTETSRVIIVPTVKPKITPSIKPSIMPCIKPYKVVIE